MKPFFITFSFIAITIANALAANYDFSAVCNSGQTLYYKITNDSEPFTVNVTYPYYNQGNHYYGYTKPSGILKIPETVTNDGEVYKVTGIESSAFSGCSGLTMVTIPSSVIAVGNYVFTDCRNLRIYCAAESKPSRWSSFWNVNYTNLEIICFYFWNTKILGEFAYRVTNNELYEVEIIGYLGNDNCVEIPAEIAINAYTKCKVTSIAANAFCYNTDITSVIIPNTVKSIGSKAFCGCTGLISANIGCSVESLGDDAFSGCTGLTSIALPISLTTIGDGAFTNCYNIESMNIKCLSPPTINSQTFLSVDKNIPVFVTCGNANTYKSTDYWKDFVTFIDNEFPYTLEVNSDDESMGAVIVRQLPTCNTNAIIEATGTNGFIFSHWNDGNTDNPRTLAVTQNTNLTAIFEKYVTANISSSDNVMGYTSNNTTYFKYGETITVSAIANYGYYFTKWSDGVTTNPRTITLTDDVEFQAQFGVNQYRITLKSNNPARGSVSGSGTFNYNTTNTITATANPNHLFVNWSDGVTNNPRQLLLTKDTVVTAIFVKEYNDLQVLSNDSELGSANGSGAVYYGTSTDISATAAAHHHFVAWSDGNRQNPRTVQVVSDTQFVATFAIDSFTVAATSRTEEFGAVSGGGLYAYGTAVEVKAEPQPHCHFVEWSNGASGLAQQFDVEKDTAFNAAFAIDTHSLRATVADSTMGVATGSGTYDYATAVTITATAAAGCYFTGWSDGVTANPRILTIVGDTVVEAQFCRLQEFGITVVPSDEVRGTVTGTGRYQSGTEATLSATANEHYYFSQWSDGRTDNPHRVRVIADATYTAVFEPEQYSVTLSQNNADMGMVSGSGQYRYGDMVSCLAKPYQNYHFVQWSNGSTANPYEFVIESNQLLTAYFAAGAVIDITDINESAAEPIIYAVGKTIVVENATNEILVYDAMGKLVCMDAIHRVRAEITVNVSGIYVVKVGNTVKRVAVE